MRIIIDARATMEPQRCGVATYAAEVTRRLVARGTNDYTLWASGSRASWPEDLPTETPDGRVRRVLTTRPNKLVNSGFTCLKWPRVEDYTGPADLLYLPNPHFFATKLTCVVTVHDLSPLRFPEFFSLKRRYFADRLLGLKKVITGANRIVATSEHTRQDVHEFIGVPLDRIDVASPGMNSRYRPQPPEEIERVRARHRLPEKYFLFVGAVEPRKNIEGLIDAFEQLPEEYGLVIAGGRGWANEGIHRRIHRTKVHKRIRHLGYVPEEDKAPLYAGAVAFVYPSFYEGFGMPPLEVMACGTPAIVSHASSLPEAVGDAGLLVNPNDPGTIAAAMLTAATDEPTRAMLRERGLRQAAKFTWDETARRVEEAFAKAAR
jgi:glycosyltransferase involved in cell wall biosynthesis